MKNQKKFRILFIVISMSLFIVWAWSPARRQDFNDAAHLAVDDDIDDDNSNNVPEADRHG